MMEFARLASALNNPARIPQHDHRQLQNLCSIVCTAGYYNPLSELLLALTRQRVKETLFTAAAPYGDGSELDEQSQQDHNISACSFMFYLSLRVHSFLNDQAVLHSAFEVLTQREDFSSLARATNDLLLIQYGKGLHAHFQKLFTCALTGCDHMTPSDSSAVNDSEALSPLSWQALFPEHSPLDAIARLKPIGWNTLFQEEIWSCVSQLIQTKVTDLCADQPEGQQMPAIDEWSQATLLPVLLSLYGSGDGSDGSTPMEMGSADARVNIAGDEEVRKRVNHMLQSAFTETRARGMFELIADFPESTPALEELASILQQTGEFHRVGSVLRDSFQRRLLHAGASSNQILDMYISTIKAVRLLDPTDLLLEYATAPVREYLKRRKDTVRCVVAGLMEGNQGDLQAELQTNSQPLDYGADSDDEGTGPGDNWMPRKRDPRMLSSSGGKGGLDVLALVVSIYGSRDLFVNEYRNMLADKLLSNLSYETDQEVRTLELLKIRFGEEILHTCEIMLRDVEESKRVNTTVHNQLKKGAERKTDDDEEGSDGDVVDATIISGEYWPGLQEGELTLHPAIESCIETYGATYSKIKAPRHLNWSKHLGLATIELDFDNGVTRKFTVPPHLATLVLHLADAGSMTSTQLAELSGMEDTDVVKRMAFWVNRGVASESASEDDYSTKVYTVIEDQSEEAAQADEEFGAGDSAGAMDEDTGAVSSDAQERAARGTYQSYVMGMLTNVRSMSIEKIHSMLRMVASSGEHRYDMSIVQLRSFLQSMIDEDKLEKLEGEYVLRKR